MIRISKTDLQILREPFIKPFGFKGGFLHEQWMLFSKFESASGQVATGMGTQSVLWSDAAVFAGHSEVGGNTLMAGITEHALKVVEETPFETPVDLLDTIFPEILEYGRKITDNPNLRHTFALNALVGIDNAAWLIYCRENGINSFDDMVPEMYRPALATKQKKVAAIPLLSYKVGKEEIKQLSDEGFFFFKIKIGSDPAGDGDQEKMVAWDKQRLSEIHDFFKNASTPHTEDGNVPYYLDANGRYDSKDRLMQLLNHAEKIGMLERIMIVEEPFPEEYKVDVGDIPARLAADESAHTDKDAQERIDLGYGAIALKPIAKTMSMSLKIAQLAHENDVPCFCADLTVPPVLVDWNKSVASRLKSLPGMNVGLLETNGHQNFRNWEKMRNLLPYKEAEWTKIKDGLFDLDNDFYDKSGGILEGIDFDVIVKMARG